jgi:hypothetical protein
VLSNVNFILVFTLQQFSSFIWYSRCDTRQTSYSS